MNSLDHFLDHHENIMSSETFSLLFEMNYIAMQEDALIIFKQKLNEVFLRNGSLMLSHKNTQDFIMVTRSSQENGRIQRTFFKNGVPLSHQTFSGLEECLVKESINWLTDYKIMDSI